MHRIVVHLRQPLEMNDGRKIELFNNLINSVCEREQCGRASVMLSLVGCDQETDRPFQEMKPVLQSSGVNWERGLTYNDRYNKRYLTTNCTLVARKFRLPKFNCKVHLITD